MTKKIVSWIIAGAASYAWWWFGFRWMYLNQEGSEWTSVYVLYTLLALLIIYRKRTA